MRLRRMVLRISAIKNHAQDAYDYIATPPAHSSSKLTSERTIRMRITTQDAFDCVLLITA